jgi:hypothetical protein
MEELSFVGICTMSPYFLLLLLKNIWKKSSGLLRVEFAPLPRLVLSLCYKIVIDAVAVEWVMILCVVKRALSDAMRITMSFLFGSRRLNAAVAILI